MTKLLSVVEAKTRNKTTISLNLLIAISLEGDNYINVLSLQKHNSRIMLVHMAVLAFSLLCVGIAQD